LYYLAFLATTVINDCLSYTHNSIMHSEYVTWV